MFQFYAQAEDHEAAIGHLIDELQILLPLAQRGALPNPDDQAHLKSRIELAQKLGLFGQEADSNGDAEQENSDEGEAHD